MAKGNGSRKPRILGGTATTGWLGNTPSGTTLIFKSEVRNGDLVSTGQNEFSLTGSGSGTGQVDWTINPSGTLDTGDTSFDMRVEKGSPNTANLTVGFGYLDRYSATTFSYIYGVGLAAGFATQNGKTLGAAWTSGSVAFYDASDPPGSVIVELAPNELPSVGRIPSAMAHRPKGPRPMDFGGTLVTPGDNTRTRVTISGTIKLYGTPLPLASFTQVYVRAYVFVV
jgi:hypothetical protein